MHRVLVQQGFTCPKCHGALFADTWSMKRQQAERDALLQQRCSRCRAVQESGRHRHAHEAPGHGREREQLTQLEKTTQAGKAKP